ncbi:hypothetical protein LR48_Vigan07g087300 [Vigna angularis]|uniref:Uncharacterized protein n=1 Tax=Phaseolus angularis TaxID=3914 RepID=A0A0L9UX93_PHAAN|nr:hypothetical protein LR48_Vigan07g087300 [Vigna angularis]
MVRRSQEGLGKLHPRERGSRDSDPHGKNKAVDQNKNVGITAKLTDRERDGMPTQYQHLFKNSHSTSISFSATHALRYLDERLVSNQGTNTKPHGCEEPTRKLFEDCDTGNQMDAGNQTDARNHISVLKKLFEV